MARAGHERQNPIYWVVKFAICSEDTVMDFICQKSVKTCEVISVGPTPLSQPMTIPLKMTVPIPIPIPILAKTCEKQFCEKV